MNPLNHLTTDLKLPHGHFINILITISRPSKKITTIPPPYHQFKATSLPHNQLTKASNHLTRFQDHLTITAKRHYCIEITS
jgi:hypothetical protein